MLGQANRFHRIIVGPPSAPPTYEVAPGKEPRVTRTFSSVAARAISSAEIATLNPFQEILIVTPMAYLELGKQGV